MQVNIVKMACKVQLYFGHFPHGLYSDLILTMNQVTKSIIINKITLICRVNATRKFTR